MTGFYCPRGGDDLAPCWGRISGTHKIVFKKDKKVRQGGRGC